MVAFPEWAPREAQLCFQDPGSFSTFHTASTFTSDLRIRPAKRINPFNGCRAAEQEVRPAALRSSVDAGSATPATCGSHSLEFVCCRMQSSIAEAALAGRPFCRLP